MNGWMDGWLSEAELREAERKARWDVILRRQNEGKINPSK